MNFFQVSIVGGGIAGLTSAYFLAKKGISVCVIDSGDGKQKKSSSQMAQGGIAGDKDWKSHFSDTMKAGEFQNNETIVELFCKEAWSSIEWLKNEIGVVFRDEPTLEGGHSKHRVWTTGDDTGFQIYRKLLEKCKEQKNIFWEHESQVLHIEKQEEGFITVFESQQEKKSISSHFLVLATGGVGGLFQFSTNPRNATGDGLLFAHQLGAKLEDLDVIQFHPTGLKLDSGAGVTPESKPVFLLSEALRGEGALLRNGKGEQFMQNFPQKELESRKTVVAEMLKQKEVFLDLRTKSKSFWKKHFPNIYKKLEEEGFDIETDLIPVIPTQHFLCGGIAVNHFSETSIKTFFAIGECASTGLHGANRLASNSLSEAIVFGKRAAQAMISDQLIMNSKTKKIIENTDNVSYLSRASFEDLERIRAVMQTYLRPDEKNIYGLKMALEDLSDSFEKQTALLFCKLL